MTSPLLQLVLDMEDCARRHKLAGEPHVFGQNNGLPRTCRCDDHQARLFELIRGQLNREKVHRFMGVLRNALSQVVDSDGEPDAFMISDTGSPDSCFVKITDGQDVNYGQTFRIDVSVADGK